MALTSGQIIALALEAAHSPGKQQQAVLLFNSILTELCQTYDFAEARGQYLFHFQPGGAPPIGVPGVGEAAVWGTMIWNESEWGGTPPGKWNAMEWGFDSWGPGISLAAPPETVVGPQTPYWPGNTFGSGPYLLPVDYLRLSGSSGSTGSQKSFIWWLNGVPYPIIPMDLAEFDLQVQQAGLNSYVWLSATDMSTPIDDRILLTTTGDVTEGSTTITNLASTARLIGGEKLGIAGQGIVPGAMLKATGGTAPQAEALMTLPANATVQGASLIFGYCPVVFVYPPPATGQQAMIRYQKRMPDIADMTRYPWFHHDSYLLEKLTGKLCQLNDDARADALLAGPGSPTSPDGKLTAWLAAKDDEPSHPKRVELDRRAFGRGWIGGNRNVTKKVGW